MYRAKIIALLASLSISAWAQSTPPPQTARQALLEMFFSKAPHALEKHLPSTVLAELKNADADSSALILQKMNSMVHDLAEGGMKIQTFDVGSTLVVAENPETQDKAEVMVERDDLSGDVDEIELSLQATKNWQPVSLPVVPRLVLLMKEENEVWRLNEITVALHVPLGNPDYIKDRMEEIQSSQDRENEILATVSLRALAQTEKSYQARQHAFSCSVADITPVDGLQGMMPSPDLKQPKEFKIRGYIFAVASCSANSFHLTATPVRQGHGLKTFCIDETQGVKFTKDDNAANCLSDGKTTDDD